MSENVRKQLELNASLPSGSKKRYRKSRSSKSNTSEPTQSKTQSSSDPPTTVAKESVNTVPAQVKAAEFDVQEAQDIVFKPNPGPQTNFLSASEREVLYGGAAGGELKVSVYRLLSQQCVKINSVNCLGTREGNQQPSLEVTPL